MLAVPRTSLDALQKICDEEGVEPRCSGRSARRTTGRAYRAAFRGRRGRMTMHFLHEGIPCPAREASWTAPEGRHPARRPRGQRRTARSAVATSPASDGSSASTTTRCRATRCSPLVGPGDGPGDASVIQPVPESEQGLAISCGLQTNLGTSDVAGGDPYTMTLSAIDECAQPRASAPTPAHRDPRQLLLANRPRTWAFSPAAPSPATAAWPIARPSSPARTRSTTSSATRTPPATRCSSRSRRRCSSRHGRGAVGRSAGDDGHEGVSPDPNPMVSS